MSPVVVFLSGTDEPKLVFVRTGGQKLYVRRASRDNGQWDDRPSKVTIELTPLAR